MAYSRPGVYISERLLPAAIPNGVSTNAAGAIAAALPQGPETVTRVGTWLEFTNYFGGYNAAYPATFGIASFFSNGGRELYVKRVLHGGDVTDSNNAKAAHVDIVTAGSATVATVTCKNAGSDGNNLRAVLSAGSVDNTYTLTLYREAGISGNISDDILLERYQNIVFDDSTSSDFAETVINTVSPNISISASASGTPVAATYTLASGSNGSTVVAADYTNYKGTSDSVFSEFSSLNRALVVFLPNIHTALDNTSVSSVYDAASSWASTNDSFVVAETAPGKTVTEALTFATGLQDSADIAVYYPHFWTADPLGRGSGAIRKVGPSGAVAGLYLSVDANRGVFKAPAGITTAIQGVAAVERNFSSADLDSMNAATAPVNPLRQIPGVGLAVMGARTLMQDGTANKYVNMRRSLNYIRKNLQQLTEFAIFENNDEILWAQIRSRINVFLNQYRNQGGLRGGSPSDSYFILCNAQNNTAQSIQNGEIHIQIGVALQYPAEFVVIDLTQMTLV
jgi:phage tail sheath protein FI